VPWREHVSSVLYLLVLIAVAIGANRFAIWANATFRGASGDAETRRLPSIDLGIVQQDEELRVEFDFRPLIRREVGGGEFSIRAVRGECRFNLKSIPDGSTESATLATLEMPAGDLSQVFHDRFEYRVELPVEVTNNGIVVGAGSLLLNVRKPLITQYPSMHFGAACRPNVPARPRTIWIRTVADVADVVATSDTDAVTAVVRRHGPGEFTLSVYPRTDRPAGSHRANLRLVARMADGQIQFGGVVPAGFELREPD
jgi:hypothetical protein